MTNADFELRRLKFIEACAYYLRIKGLHDDIDRLEMTSELAELISERFRATNIEWAIMSARSYQKLLEDGMNETLTDFEDETLDISMVLRHNFRSMVEKEVRDKESLVQLQKIPSNGIDKNANMVCNSLKSLSIEPTTKPSARTPHDILEGFSVFIKPDVHLDETIPICARDQHLLWNIFGVEWKSPVVINAYTTVKGQTGFMLNRTSNGENTKSPK